MKLQSTPTIKLITEEECPLFRKWVALFLSNIYVKKERIEKFINLNMLVEQESIHSFEKLHTFIELLIHPESTIKYAKKYPSKNMHAIIALHFLNNQDMIEQAERNNTAQLANNESAQDKKLVLKAQKIFLKIQTVFQAQFNSYGENDTSRIENIERHIKSTLLDLILAEAIEQKSKNIHPERQAKIINFINDNRNSLIDKNEGVTRIFREMLLSLPNPMNTTHFQTAWLSYDAGHIVRRTNDTGWDSYRKFFTPPPIDYLASNTYTTREASDGAISNPLAALEVLDFK